MCKDPYCRICNPPKENYCYENNYCPPQNNSVFLEENFAAPRPDFANLQEFPPRPSFLDDNSVDFEAEAINANFVQERSECPCCGREHHDKKRPDDKKCPDIQTHNHEFAGSVVIAGKIPHTHRFAGVTSEAIPYKKSHVHAILVSTDFFFNHYHEIGLRTGPAIDIGDGKHIHVAEGETTENFGHDHKFIFTTFIENPLQKGRR